MVQGNESVNLCFHFFGFCSAWACVGAFERFRVLKGEDVRKFR